MTCFITAFFSLCTAIQLMHFKWNHISCCSEHESSKWIGFLLFCDVIQMIYTTIGQLERSSKSKLMSFLGRAHWACSRSSRIYTCIFRLGTYWMCCDQITKKTHNWIWIIQFARTDLKLMVDGSHLNSVKPSHTSFCGLLLPPFGRNRNWCAESTIVETFMAFGAESEPEHNIF